MILVVGKYFCNKIIMSTIRKRRRRANPEDLYRSCRITGNCPPDIKNRFEQNTLADKILKYGSTAVYFGGLGIGTGSGRAGPGTIGRGGGISLGSAPARPSIPIDDIGPADLIPIDAVDPLGPSIVPPERFPTAVEEDPFILRPPRFPEAYDEQLPPGGAAGGAEVSTGSASGIDDPAVLLVQPDDTIVSRTHYDNPSFQVTLHSTGAASAETSATDTILVTQTSVGVVVGGEEEFIPLRDVTPIRPRGRALEGDFQETSFTTSTPVEVQGAPRGRSVNFLSRRFQQIQIQDPAFLTRPRTLVAFDNEAFEALDEDISLIFEQDVESVAAAPHSDFTDIRALSRPTIQRGRGGGVRVSRIGQRGTISTRSGVQIGAQVHFYYDISGIEPVDTIELRSLGEQSMQSEIVTGQQNFEEVSLTGTLESSVPESDLIDDLNTTVGEGVQLVFIGGGDEDQVVPLLAEGIDLTVRRPPHFSPDFGVTVYYPETTKGKGKVIPDSGPDIIIKVIGGSDDYDLHPSLIRRKRKRAYF